MSKRNRSLQNEAQDAAVSMANSADKRLRTEVQNTTNVASFKEKFAKAENEKVTMLCDILTNMETSIHDSVNQLKEDFRAIIREEITVRNEIQNELKNVTCNLVYEPK